MKIEYVAQDVDGVTGLGRIVTALARGMAAAGHDVDVVCQRSDRTDIRTVRLPGCPAFPSMDKALFRLASPFANRGRRPDVRHSFGVGSWAHVVSAQSCHRAGVELQRSRPTGRVRRRNFGLFDRITLADERRLMTAPTTRAILAVSRLVRDQLMHWYNVPEDKIVVVPNGIDPAKYQSPLDREAVRAVYGMRDDHLILGFLGNEFDRKGVQTILEALPAFRDLPIQAVIAGADDPGPYMHRAVQLGVEPMVHFTGRIERPESFLRVLDLFVFPVDYEPFGMVVTEAMAAGVPVITTRTVGAVEEMTDGVEGVFLEDSLSASELAAAIRRVMNDADLRSRLVAGGKNAVAHLDWTVICDRVEEVYRRIAGGGGKA